jgi:hypothetical protein
VRNPARHARFFRTVLLVLQVFLRSLWFFFKHNNHHNYQAQSCTNFLSCTKRRRPLMTTVVPPCTWIITQAYIFNLDHHCDLSMDDAI